MKSLFMLLCFILVTIYSCAPKQANLDVLESKKENRSYVPISADSFEGKLLGKWEGMVVTNMKSPLGGGKPTVGETGTPLKFEFYDHAGILKGNIQVGQVLETWEFEINGLYSWSDTKIQVRTKQISLEKTPKWILERMKIKDKKNVRFYAFESCSLLSTKKVCQDRTDLPEGVSKTGIWAFYIQGNKLFSHVYYSYKNDGKRILEQVLTKR